MESQSIIIAGPRELPHCGDCEEHKTAVRNWLDLPHDLTLAIISRLDIFQIFTRAQLVCRQWRTICLDPLMWRTINICHILMVDNYSMDLDCDTMCFRAVDRSCGLLEDISIEYFGFDHLLKFIILSESKLRRLRLVQCYRNIPEGLFEIAGRRLVLEELDITYCHDSGYSVVLEAIGRGCPLLKSLKFNENDGYFDVNNDQAFAIAKNMPNLRHLQLVRNSMNNSGVSAILDGCPLLESLDLRGCVNVELDDELRRRCDVQLKDFIEPDTPLAFRGYEFGLLFYGKEYNETQFDDSWSYYSSGFQFEEEEKEEVKEEEAAPTEDCEEMYGIWECAKNQRSRNAFKTYLTEKEKKKKKKNYKSKGKKKHIRKEGALITTKSYISCFEMEESE